jgi:hypothetical protein
VARRACAVLKNYKTLIKKKDEKLYFLKSHGLLNGPEMNTELFYFLPIATVTEKPSIWVSSARLN